MKKWEIKFFVTRCFMKICSLLYPIRKQAFFESFSGRQYSDNPRAISEELHKQYPDYRIIWSLSKPRETDKYIPDYVCVIRQGSLRYYKELSRSFLYVTNETILPNILKRKGQMFIQTWHGDRAFKKILYQVRAENSEEPLIMDNQYTDVCIAGSRSGERLFREAFRYDGDILTVGCPRNDCLLTGDEQRAAEIKRNLGLPLNKKIVLYAPTFRDHKRDSSTFYVDLSAVLKELNSDKDEWAALYRAHPTVENNQTEKEFMNCTSYPDMTDLLLICDLLITDYSSCATDFIISKKPVILAAFDIDDYIENCRELAVDFQETGFLIAKNMEELIQLIRNLDSERVEKEYDDVCRYFGVLETGLASKTTCELVEEHYNRKVKTHKKG